MSELAEAPPEATYVPGPVERYGRRMKMEYVGMGSVYFVVSRLFFDLEPLSRSVVATFAAFFLFLGLKKKTRDHLSGSLILFLAVAVAAPAVKGLEWLAPGLFFAVCVYAMEGYLEKRQGRIHLLPVVFFLWGMVDYFWIPGLIFVALYLNQEPGVRPEFRRRLPWMVSAAAVLAVVSTFLPIPSVASWLATPEAELVRHPLDTSHFLLLAAITLPTLYCLFRYWSKLVFPHRFNTLIFAAVAPLDLRLAAMFAMVAAVLLAATAFRRSIDSDALRPIFKHAEWHFFWYVLAVAIWATVTH